MKINPDDPRAPMLRVRYDLIGCAARLRTALGEVPEEALTNAEVSAIQDALAHLDDAQQSLGDRLRDASWQYFLVLTPEEYETLLWMGQRGYEAGLVECADMVYGYPRGEEINPLHPGLVTLCYYGHNVQGTPERVSDDVDAWGAGAPRALLSKLQALLGEIN